MDKTHRTPDMTPRPANMPNERPKPKPRPRSMSAEDRRDIERIKLERTMAKASLELSYAIEDVQKKHGLSVVDVLELLHKQSGVYLREVANG